MESCNARRVRFIISAQLSIFKRRFGVLAHVLASFSESPQAGVLLTFLTCHWRPGLLCTVCSMGEFLEFVEIVLKQRLLAILFGHCLLWFLKS